MNILSALLANTGGTPLGNIDCTTGSFCPNGDPTVQADALINLIIKFLSIMAGLAFFIYFVLGAVTWVTAGGDKGNVDKAKTMMTNAAIGMIIIAASYAVVWIIQTVLGIPILNPFPALFNTGATP